MINVALEQGCVKADKLWCEDNCRAAGVPETTSQWTDCLTKCGSEANQKVSAFAKALAQIKADTNTSCINLVDPIGAVYVTVQTLQVRALSGTCMLL